MKRILFSFLILSLIYLSSAFSSDVYARLDATCNIDFSRASYANINSSSISTAVSNKTDPLSLLQKYPLALQSKLSPDDQLLNQIYDNPTFLDIRLHPGAGITVLDPLKPYTFDLAYSFTGDNGKYQSSVDNSVTNDQCSNTHINEMCVSSGTLDGTTDGGRYQSALPDNPDSACYSYCQCGVMVGTIEGQELNAIIPSGNGVSTSTTTRLSYANLLFVPTTGGEISDTYIPSQLQSFTTLGLSAFSSVPGFTPVTFALNQYTCPSGICDFTKPQVVQAPVPVAGKAGYFCGFAHNAIATNAVPNTISGSTGGNSWEDANNFDQNFQSPGGSIVRIGADINAYISHTFGHGIDTETDPSTTIDSYSESVGSPDHSTVHTTVMNLQNIPTVCVNGDAYRSGVNSGDNKGVVKFVPIRGSLDCDAASNHGGPQGNYFACRYDDYKTMKACPSGTHLDTNKQVVWGWPCLPDTQDPQQVNPNTQFQDIAAKTRPSNPHDVSYSSWPFIYAKDQLVNPAGDNFFKQPKACTDTDQSNCMCTDANSCRTALGVIHTDVVSFLGDLMKYILGFGGAVALILIIFGGYQLISSEGNPDKVKAARERITSAVIGLLFMIFSGVFLQVLGVDILNLPGLGK